MQKSVENCVIISGNDGYPFQDFNGKRYHLYKGEKYYSKGNTRLHVAVYKYYFGKVKKGYHVHHKDEDRTNNYPSNLEQMEGREHMTMHNRKQDKDKLRERIKHASQFAKVWHGSKEGIEWHREHVAASIGKAHEKNISCKCEQCGKEYLSNKANLSTTKFCSKNCKSIARRLSGVDDENRDCIVCGKSFITNRYTKIKTCGRVCGGKAISATRLHLKGRGIIKKV
jgi:hypothetical protein